MSVIGTFTPSKDGGWNGTIRTFSSTLKARFIPNDDRRSDVAPDFHVVSAKCELGVAWIRRKNDQTEYLSVQFDDPVFARPIAAALFYSADTPVANLVWRRDETREQV